MKYVTYKTIYTGNLLPPFYIGSTTKERIESGKYFGSIKSKKWKDIFKSEIKNNKHLFSVEILSYHNSREEALKEELRIQILNDVVKSNKYFNESLASPTGMFGRDVSGSNNPMFGKRRIDSSERMKGDNNIAKRIDVKEKLKKAKINHVPWIKGKKHSEKTKKKISISMLGIIPPNKGKISLEEQNRREVILSYIMKNNSATRLEITNLFEKNNDIYRKISWSLTVLRKNKKIYNIGSCNKSKWVLYNNIINGQK